MSHDRPAAVVAPTTSSACTKESSAPPHPFGKELEQVNEVVEEFGGAQVILDEEEQQLLASGLHKFTVDEYILEIEDLYQDLFRDEYRPPRTAWI